MWNTEDPHDIFLQGQAMFRFNHFYSIRLPPLLVVLRDEAQCNFRILTCNGTSRCAIAEISDFDRLFPMVVEQGPSLLSVSIFLYPCDPKLRPKSQGPLVLQQLMDAAQIAQDCPLMSLCYKASNMSRPLLQNPSCHSVGILPACSFSINSVSEPFLWETKYKNVFSMGDPLCCSPNCELLHL